MSTSESDIEEIRSLVAEYRKTGDREDLIAAKELVDHVDQNADRCALECEIWQARRDELLAKPSMRPREALELARIQCRLHRAGASPTPAAVAPLPAEVVATPTVEAPNTPAAPAKPQHIVVRWLRRVANALTGRTP